MEFAFDPAQPPPSTATKTTTTTGTTIATSTTGTTTGTTEVKKLKLLVAIDDSDWSFYALKWVLDNILASSVGVTEITGEFHNTIVLLHVQAPFQHYVYPAGPGIIPPIYPNRDIADSARKMRQAHAAIVLAIDDSDWSFYALKWVLDNILASSVGVTEITGEFHNTIVLLHVQAPFQHYVYPAGPGIIPPIYPNRDIADSARKMRQAHAAIVLARAIDICKGRKVRVESMILEGDPKEMICEAVDRIHCDLLVVGSRGLGKIKRAFLGSVSDYCAHHANCPVLIVKPPK